MTLVGGKGVSFMQMLNQINAIDIAKHFRLSEFACPCCKRVMLHPLLLKSVLISSCGFPEIENFDILRRHFRKICDEANWIWSGEILIPAAGIANAPKLFDRKYELIRKAGAELIDGQISKETMDGISAPVMPAEDYRKMATTSFAGGVMGKMKTVWIAMNAMRKANKKD